MINMTTASPTTAPLDPIALDALRKQIQGHVYTPADDGYDTARAGFSLMDLPSPDLVVVVASSDDVVAAVNFARHAGLPIGVKATGHNFGFPYRGGLLINTELLQGVAIDPLTRTARVEAGVRWRAVVGAAQEHGLAPLNGAAPHVGVVGYSLFGGFGWLLRKYGAAVDSVLEIEVVTADGTKRLASANNEPELFWALRGASGNFGVVTAIKFKLYPVTEVYGGVLFFPLERAREVLSTYSRWVETVPDELTSAIVMQRIPPLPDVPEPLRGRAVVAVRAAFLGTEADGIRALAPLRALGDVIVDTFSMLPYTKIGTIANDPTTPLPVFRTTGMLRDLSPATIETLISANGVDGTSPVMILEIRHLGGALSRVPADSTAFSQRYAPFLFQTVDLVFGPEDAPRSQQHTNAIAAALQPHTTGGVLPSWLGDGDHGVERMRAGFTAEHYTRLVALKERYDPANTFRLNHNIPPSGRAAHADAATSAMADRR